VRTRLRVSVRTNQLTMIVKKEVKAEGSQPTWENMSGDEQVIAKNVGALIDGQPVKTSGHAGSDSPKPK